VPIRTWLLVFALAAAPAQATHDKAFWQSVRDTEYAVPAGESLPALARELSGYLASPDPELRDDIAFNTLARWIYFTKVVPPDLVRSLTSDWMANLATRIGEDGTDSVLRRSFSALMLSIVVARDNEDPYLERAEFERLLDATLRYLQAERDIRGFDAEKGWMHSVAHTADVLKFMGRSRYLLPAEQKRILDAIASKVGTVDEVLTHGEDERLARAVLSIVARPDADLDAFRSFLEALGPATPGEAGTTAALLTVNQNRRHLAVSLFTVLSTDPRDLGSIEQARAMTLAFLR
jgi:hypothetical protein